MRLALPHLIVGMFTAGLLFVVLKDYAIESAAIIWLTANLLLLACTVTFYSLYYFRRHIFTLPQWGKVTFFVSLLWGLCWSLPPFILLDTNSILYIGILVTFIIAMSAVPAPVLVHYPSAYFVFITLPLGSLTLKTTITPIENQHIIQFLPPFLWASLLVYGWDLHKTIIESIRLRLENELALGEARQANIAKAKFIAAASHDIRQPLQAAVLSLDAIKANQGKALDSVLPNLEKSVDSISDLITGLLDVSKLDSGTVDISPEHLEFKLILGRLYAKNALLAETKGLALTHNTPSDSTSNLTIYADPTLLDRVLNNLVANAIRYTDRGEITVGIQQGPEHLTFRIEDTGIGISPEKLELIFEEFYQVSSTERDQKIGLGLGLSIVKRLCELQNWQLDVSSVPGEGSCFSVRVPLGDKQKIKSLERNPVGSLSGLCALVIDDNAAIRDSLSTLLGTWQCQVVVADSAKSAIDALNSNPANSTPLPDIIISDYQLANRQSGIDAIKEVQRWIESQRDKSDSTNTEALLMTGDTDPERLNELAKSGITVMHKPIKPGHLRTFIHRRCLNSQ